MKLIENDGSEKDVIPGWDAFNLQVGIAEGKDEDVVLLKLISKLGHGDMILGLSKSQAKYLIESFTQVLGLSESVKHQDDDYFAFDALVAWSKTLPRSKPVGVILGGEAFDLAFANEEDQARFAKGLKSGVFGIIKAEDAGKLDAHIVQPIG